MFGGLAGLLASRKRVVDEQSEICDSVATGIGSLASERRTHAAQVFRLFSFATKLQSFIFKMRLSPIEPLPSPFVNPGIFVLQ